MKSHALCLLPLFHIFVCSVLAQGTLVYDQQSTSGNTGESAANLVTAQQLGQSFTPTLSAIDFVTLQLGDGNSINGIGASIFISIFSGSLTNGTLLGSTTPLLLPNGFGQTESGFTNFFFQTTIPLTPGATYYLRPILQTGDSSFFVTANTFNYSGGTAFYQGSPLASVDLAFREGIVSVPEPGALALAALGTLLLGCRRWKK